jgi:tellurite resistance protein TehA-like permease
VHTLPALWLIHLIMAKAEVIEEREHPLESALGSVGRVTQFFFSRPVLPKPFG